jgi:hypothetical protein
MANFVKATDFASKDALLTGDPAKIIKGTEIDTEFNAISVAVSTKADTVSPTFIGTPAAPTASPGTNTTQIATTAFAKAAVDAATASLGTMSTQAANNVAITGGSVTGITDLTVADGGTGASTADNARTNLDVPSRSGANASGTWGISITGNAATSSNVNGVGQTWSNLTGSRAFNGTIYSNTTGRPITIAVSWWNGNKAGHNLNARVIGAGSWIRLGRAGDRDFGGQNTITAIIPSGWEYMVDTFGDSFSEQVWSELR